MLMALVFVTVIALIIGALLNQSAAQFRAAKAFGDRRAGVFAADAGLEHALAGVGMITDPPAPGTTPTPVNHEEVSDDDFVFFGTGTVTLDNFAVGSAPGAHRLMLVAVANNDEHPPQSVSFGSHPMLRAGQAAEAGDNSTSLWYLLLDGDVTPPLATGSYDIVVTSPWVLFEGFTYAIHASLWTGVLQQVNGVPYAFTDSGWAQTNSSVDVLRTDVSTDTSNALVVSAAGRDGGGSMGLPVGTTQLTSSPGADDSIFGTSYAVVPAVTPTFTAEEHFSSAGAPATQAVVAFRPASWMPLRFGGACEPAALGPYTYNGYNVTVTCELNVDGDALTITSTATEGARQVVGQATVTRLPSGTIEITEWDTRTGAGGSSP
jgi:hypothetical protein